MGVVPPSVQRRREPALPRDTSEGLASETWAPLRILAPGNH